MSVNVFVLRREEILSFESHVCAMDFKNANKTGNRKINKESAQDFLVKSLHEPTWIIS